MLTNVIDVLSDSLWAITWDLVGVIFLAGALALGFKIFEKKLFAFIKRKKYEAEHQAEYDEELAKQIKIDRSTPTFEEWKAQQSSQEELK